MEFDIFFDIATTPYRLGFLIPGKKFELWMNVRAADYEIKVSLGTEDYKRLAKALNLKYDPNHKFSPFEFFKEFNDKIPDTLPEISHRKRTDIITYAHDDIEEKDKLCQKGQKDWDSIGNGYKRSAENLKKTRLLYPGLYKSTKDKNISIIYKRCEDE